MKKIKASLFTIAVLLVITNSLAQDKSNGILFLEFSFIKGTPRLISMKAVKGKLKNRKNVQASNKEYLFEVFSDHKSMLYKNSFENPAETIYEYPGDNGEIKRTKIKRDTANIILRIPYSPEINKIIIYKNVSSTALLKHTNETSYEKFEFPITHSLIEK